MNNSAYEYIDTDTALYEACEQLASHRILAIDTEFQRETTYYPIPALIQLHAADFVFLVDPTRISDFSPLTRLFRNADIVKIMHSCDEDLEVFNQLLQCLPVPLFDTQIAAALCELGFSISYSRLVEELTGNVLDKSETRSNWLQRPLSTSQCQYAVEDVLWLPELYQQLAEILKNKQRTEWCEQECDRLLARGQQEINPQDTYLRFKSAWRLTDTQLHKLRALSAWREIEARNLDVPRGRVISDSALFELAQCNIKSMTQLKSIQGIGNYTVRKYGDKLLSMLAENATENTHKLVDFPDKKSRPYRDLLKAMQKVVRKTAEIENLPPELLGRKKDLEDYLMNPDNSVITLTWRKKLIGDELDKAIARSKNQ